ncbi:hypothetical protein [Methanogenium cariaci]|nr:hypothetical protein [Methanogenium cariaci]
MQSLEIPCGSNHLIDLLRGGEYKEDP